MDLEKTVQSKKFKWILGSVAGLIIALLIFQLGVFVGFHKARFSYGWGDNYSRMFGGPRGGPLRDFKGQEFINGHGTAGTIVKIDGDNIVMKGQDNIEKIVTTTSSTAIRSGASNIKIADLKSNESIVVIGEPEEDGTIQAQLIRVFAQIPSPANATPPLSTPNSN